MSVYADAFRAEMEVELRVQSELEHDRKAWTYGRTQRIPRQRSTDWEGSAADTNDSATRTSAA